MVRSSLLHFWLVSLCALIGIGVTLSLGRWQLSRAAQKVALQTEVQEGKKLAALDAKELLATKNIATEIYHPVQLRGTWLPRYTVFLDNREMNETAGFFVMTPLQLEHSDTVILVQRGWVQRNFLNRTALPAVDTPAGTVEVSGRIAPPPSKLFAFKGADTGVIRQNLDLVQFRAETRLPLLGVSVVQTGAPSEGLQRDWPPVNTGVETNYGYAFQWFALSGLIAILYVWFQIVRRFIAPTRQRPPV
ncbi:MAG: SURF1 family protein [Rhodoferax sp.]|nr:SURF1 family protein [Rhodoferax sp.]